MAEEDRTALKSLNTIAINLLYTDRVEDNAYYMATPKHKKPKLTMLVDPCLVIITIYLVCLIHTRE